MSSVISLQSNAQFSGNVAFYVDFHEGVGKSWPNGKRLVIERL